MATRDQFPPLLPIARGIAHRMGRAFRHASADALSELRGPVIRQMRQWVAGAVPALRHYDGTLRGRRGAGWDASPTGVNVEIYHDFQRLRDRARERVRNDPLATRIVDASTMYVIGTGIIPKSATGSAVVDRKVDALWQAWARATGFYAKQALAWHATVESGEALTRRRPRKVSAGLPVPLDVDVLEGDYLDHNLTGIWSTAGVPDGNYLIQGVEFDASGQRVAYHLWTQHPGEMGLIQSASTQLKRVRVLESELLHMYRVLRPGQVRGVTILAPVLWTLRQIGMYLDADLERKGMEALVTAIVSNADPVRPGIGDLSNGPTDSQGRMQVIGDLQPGTVLNVDGATGVTFNNPQPSDSASALKGMIRRVATGIGIPYELLSADLEGVNYSSIRYGTLPMRLGVWMQQEHVVLPWNDRVWGWFIEAAILSGALSERKGGYPCEWAPPQWEEVDRLKEAMADVLEIRAGLSSQDEVLARRGKGWVALLAEAKEWLAACDKANLSFDTDPRRPEKEKADVAGNPSDPTADPAANPAPADVPKKPKKQKQAA
jgi:lambda family phage portal protein